MGCIVGKLLRIHFWKTAVISELVRYCLHQVTMKRENNSYKFPELMAPSSAQYREYNRFFFIETNNQKTPHFLTCLIFSYLLCSQY